MSTLAKFNDTTAWNAYYDARVMQGVDQDVARREADALMEMVKMGKAERRAERRQAMFNAWVNFWVTFGWWCLGAFVLAGVAVLIFWITTLNDTDYAGYGKRHVLGHARDAVQSYYGQNDAPGVLNLRGMTHDRLYGQKAWKVNYLTDEGKRICAWVWQGKQIPGATAITGTNFYKVGEGAAC